MLQSPEGAATKHAIQFKFSCTNNEAEYEALLAELKLARDVGAEHLSIFSDSAIVPSFWGRPKSFGCRHIFAKSKSFCSPSPLDKQRIYNALSGLRPLRSTNSKGLIRLGKSY